MYRQPLFPTQLRSPKLNDFANFEFPVLDIHELAAGKLSALLTRVASRDLFDAHHLLTNTALDEKKLRFAFVVYISMTALPLSLISLESISYEERDLHNRLLPVVRQKDLSRSRTAIKTWAKNMARELKVALNSVLPLHDDEAHFISNMRDAGIIDASIITDDIALQQIVENHPALQWALIRNKRKQSSD